MVYQGVCVLSLAGFVGRRFAVALTLDPLRFGAQPTLGYNVGFGGEARSA